MNIEEKLNLKKGFGLVEALIALVIIAITMIAALRTVASSIRQVKNNEIEDKANELMSSTLEYAYGYRNIDLPIIDDDPPTEFPLQAFITTPGQFLCFSSVLDLSTDQSRLVYVNNGETGCEKIGGSNINYQVTYENATEESEVIYHQVIFSNTPVSESGQLVDKIRITSIVLYEYEGQILRQRLDAYRPLYF
ncbi:type II secretion system protein [Candidatus Dojkabacteria bacterium]|nr:type II secretion system protein [Candidatus Dojkabacteria bacterium]